MGNIENGGAASGDAARREPAGAGMTREGSAGAAGAGMTRRGFVKAAAAASAVSAAAAASGPAGALAQAAEAGYTPGTYECQVIGIDLMTVSMTFSESAIESVDIDANESPELGMLVIGGLADQIVSAQSPDIDVVAGATVTSKAVRAAARNCVAQARGEALPLEVDDLISPIAPAEAPDAWDYESDVVIVGASVAGLTAAAKLAQNGVSVTVLEKESKVGGTARITTCIGNYGGNKLVEQGYFADPYHDQDVMDYFQERATWSIDSDLLRNITVSLRETFDWWVDNDISLVGIGTWWAMPYPSQEGHAGEDEAAPTVAYLALWEQQLAEENGAKFLLSSPADCLVTDGEGGVVGVKAQNPDGAAIWLKADTAVILAADSFQTNPKMMQAYGGLAAGVKSGLAKGTGQVIRMGQGAGAAMSGIGSFAASTSMPIPDGARAMLPMRRNYDGMNYVCANPWCRFDARGERVTFVDGSKVAELGQGNDSIDCNHRQCAQDLAHGDTFIVFDSDWLSDLADNGATQFRAAWGKLASCPACMADPNRRVPEYFGSTDIEQNMEDAVADSSIKRADTLEELAGLMGLDADLVVSCVERWNADCEAGEGDPVHGYTAQNMSPVANPPFYGARLTPGLYAAFAGLKVTAENQVVGEDGQAIPGLYAAFHTAGGIAGEQQQLCPIGDQIGSMCASGYNIAKALLGEEWRTI